MVRVGMFKGVHNERNFKNLNSVNSNVYSSQKSPTIKNTLSPGKLGDIAYNTSNNHFYGYSTSGWVLLDNVVNTLQQILQQGDSTGSRNITFPNNQTPTVNTGFLRITGLTGVPTGNPGSQGQLAYYNGNLYTHTGSGTWQMVNFNPSTITINDTIGSGFSVINNGIGPNLTVKTLLPGNNISITDHGDELEIEAVGSGGGSPTAVTGFSRDPNATSGAVTFDWKIVQHNKLISFVGFISIFSGNMGSSSYLYFVQGMPAPAAAYGGSVQFMCQYNVDNNDGPPGSKFPGNYGDLIIQNNGKMLFSGNGVNTFTAVTGSNALYVQGSYFVD